MLTHRIGFALLFAAAAMPAGASRMDPEAAASPLAIAIALQGDQALRDIRRDARVCLTALKPAPLDVLFRVKHEMPAREVAQVSL